MYTLQFKQWAFIAAMMVMVVVSCTGGGQGGSGFEDGHIDKVLKAEQSQELDCGHVHDMEMMADNNSR
jgi:hypothetical protein